MSRLYIAEKPDVARALREALELPAERLDGYFKCSNGDMITWCYGHMLQLMDPEDYDPKYQQWSFEHLPIVHIPWRKKPLPDSAAQLQLIGKLLQQATEVVHAGDPDDEGQLLVDEVLEYFSCRLPVKRVLINDNNASVVRKALARMRDNTEYRGLSQSAEARSVSDQLYGYNLTRAYTLKAREQGFNGVLSVGRVQTPMLGLVVRRDRENQNHVKQYYYQVQGNFEVSGQVFSARYQPQVDTDVLDDKGRLARQDEAEAIARECSGQSAKILAAKISHKTQAPPLPYNLLKLQADCARKFGLKPDQVKDITQALREKYKLITYNRSDCQYLNDEHHAEAPVILAAIGQNAPLFARALAKADPTIKSRAFNNEKVSAHHGIIPTRATADFSHLTEDEQRIYLLIARSYIAQFYPVHEFDQTDLSIQVGQRQFGCRSHSTTAAGWQMLYKNDQGNAETQQGGEEGAEDISEIDLRNLQQGDTGCCRTAEAVGLETKPKPLYTVDTLLNDLTRVAKYIQNDQLRKILIEKDKEKEGEHGGIGTPATRDEILRNLFDRGYLVEKGKHIVSSEIGRQLYDALPDQAKYPDMTALWHQQQQYIVKGELDAERFVRNLMEYIGGEVARVQQDGIQLAIKKYPCPNCGKPLRRMKGGKGFFWGCTGYKDGCKTSFSDKAGRPVLVPKKPEPSSKYECAACGSKLIRRAGKRKGTHFWGCSSYPDCKQYYPDLNGKPDYSQTKG